MVRIGVPQGSQVTRHIGFIHPKQLDRSNLVGSSVSHTVLHSTWNHCSRHALNIKIWLGIGDYLDESRYYRSELLLELNLDVSPEELLIAESAFTYADLCVMLESGDMVLWLTKHAV
jgi:hypothetical protein